MYILEHASKHMNVHTRTGELTHLCTYYDRRVNTYMYILEHAS